LGGTFGGKNIIPEGSEVDPLILQNRYMAIGAEKNTIASGIRVPIKAYDATFAHAYPFDGSLTAGDISTANYCQFFKHATSPNDILDTDIINKAYDYDNPITIQFCALKNDIWHTYDTE
jgi:hypothetical protein